LPYSQDDEALVPLASDKAPDNLYKPVTEFPASNGEYKKQKRKRREPPTFEKRAEQTPPDLTFAIPRSEPAKDPLRIFPPPQDYGSTIDSTSDKNPFASPSIAHPYQSHNPFVVAPTPPTTSTLTTNFVPSTISLPSNKPLQPTQPQIPPPSPSYSPQPESSGPEIVPSPSPSYSPQAESSEPEIVPPPSPSYFPQAESSGPEITVIITKADPGDTTAYPYEISQISNTSPPHVSDVELDDHLSVLRNYGDRKSEDHFGDDGSLPVSDYSSLSLSFSTSMSDSYSQAGEDSEDEFLDTDEAASFLPDEGSAEGRVEAEESTETSIPDISPTHPTIDTYEENEKLLETLPNPTPETTDPPPPVPPKISKKLRTRQHSVPSSVTVASESEKYEKSSKRISATVREKKSRSRTPPMEEKDSIRRGVRRATTGDFKHVPKFEGAPLSSSRSTEELNLSPRAPSNTRKPKSPRVKSFARFASIPTKIISKGGGYTLETLGSEAPAQTHDPSLEVLAAFKPKPIDYGNFLAWRFPGRRRKIIFWSN
jgi:hypothetical protein